MRRENNILKTENTLLRSNVDVIKDENTQLRAGAIGQASQANA